MSNTKMTIWKSFTAAAVFLGMSGSLTAVAEAQQSVSPTRGGVKVRPRVLITDTLTPALTRGSSKVQSRVFNPFDVTSKSRLSIDPFGFFTVTRTGTPAAPAANTAAAPAATVPEIAAGVTTSAAASGEMPEMAFAVRPPYRPPVRSPFRPPPRPPF